MSEASFDCVLASKETVLTADDLVALRKPPELPTLQAVGTKYYEPSGDGSEEAEVNSLLQERGASLCQNRVARIGDLIVADWNEELQKSFTDKLKGKITQHMGRSVNGRVALSPEETMYLLEGGHLDLHLGGVPVSSKEAYAVILNRRLSAEKYQVYCHLTRQGFLVVLHQENLGVTRYEKKLNLDKHSLKRKRMHKKREEPKKSVRTEAPGLLDEISSEHTNNACDTGHPPEFSGRNSVTNFVDIVSKLNRSDLSFPGAQTGELTSDSQEEKEVNGQQMEEEPGRNGESVDSEEYAVLGEAHERQVSDVQDLAGNDESDYNLGSNDGTETLPHAGELVMCDEEEKSELDVQQESDVSNMEENNEDSSCCVINDDNAVQEAAVSVDEENGDSDGDEDDKRSTTMDGGTVDSESVMGIDTDNDTCDVDSQDPDVVVVKVTRKETKPLAVIDLLSDDESDAEARSHAESHSCADDDDEIQFIEECAPGAPLEPPGRERKASVFARSDHLKSEASGYPVAKIDHTFNDTVRWPFPNLLRKTVVCLPRPPPHLLPLNVQMSKEAYTIDLRTLTGNNNNNNNNPTPRVWNSYKDLQTRKKGGFQGHPKSRDNFHRNSYAERPFSPNFRPSDSRSGRRETGSVIDPHVRELPFSETSTNFASSRMQPQFFEPETMNQNALLPLPCQTPYPADQDPMSTYINFAKQTAMHIAQNVLHSMTHSFYPSGPPSYPGMAFSGFPHCAVGKFPGQFVPSMLDDAVPRNSPLPNRWGDGPRSGQQGSDSRSPHLIQPPNSSIPHGFADSRQSVPEQWNRSLSSNFRPNNNNWPRGDQWEPPFPSGIPKFPSRASSWREFKSVLNDSEEEDGSVENEIMEVPIILEEVLWSRAIGPLVKPHTHEVKDVLKSLQITKSANLLAGNIISEKFMPTSGNFEIAFDVYLPGCVYKKSCPSVPSHRIVVAKSTDPFPRTSDIVFLQRKFKDDVPLQFAVVDDGDVAFYSFNHINLPTLHSEQ